MKYAACRIFTILAGLCIVAPVNAFTVNLEPENWYLLSVPGETVGSIADLFSGQLAESDYNVTWTVYRNDKSNQNYLLLNANDALQTGEGFWFVHYSNSSISFEVPENSPVAQLTPQSICPSEYGCFEYDLPIGSGISWSIVGAPFIENTAISDIRLVTNSGPCQASCTIDQAYEAGLSGNSFSQFSTTSNSYDPLGSDEILMAGDGHWFPTTITSEFGPARLLIPSFCLP